MVKFSIYLNRRVFVMWIYRVLHYMRGFRSLQYPQSMFEQKYEKYQKFYLKTFIFFTVKFSIYLNRCVFVMICLTVRVIDVPRRTLETLIWVFDVLFLDYDIS